MVQALRLYSGEEPSLEPVLQKLSDKGYFNGGHKSTENRSDVRPQKGGERHLNERRAQRRERQPLPAPKLRDGGDGQRGGERRGQENQPSLRDDCLRLLTPGPE